MHHLQPVRIAQAFIGLSLTLLSQSPLMAQALVNTEAQATTADLPATEAHIRQGIIILNELKLCLAAIDNQYKADEASSKIIEYQRKLTQWGQGFTALPKDDIDVQKSYEKAYLPIIQNINAELEIQSQRLSAAEYYQSSKLAAALVNLVEETN